MRYFLPLLFISGFMFSCSIEKSPDTYETLNYNLYFGDNKAGYFQSAQTGDGSYKFVFEYNDRGRGPHLEETISLDKNGLIASLQIIGHNYLKDSVAESFESSGGKAVWSSRTEKGNEEARKNTFYVGVNSAFGNTELLTRKMLNSPGQSIDLYPSGSLKISEVEAIKINDSLDLKLIETVGFAFSPSYIWFDKHDRFFAAPSTWLTCIRDGYESVADQLLEIQTAKEKAYYAKTAQALTEKTEGKTLISNVNVFDAEKGRLLMSQNVLINGNKIESVQASLGDSPEAAKTIDGTGKTLLPGLFDMHTHLSRSDGILNLAAGVTSVRDLANSFDLPEIRDEFNADKVLGPRILVMSGFIDQAGPYAGPIGKIIKSLDEGLDAIDFYKERGYQNIKLYSSIDPAWVKPLADKAHRLGLRVSGHIPAYMLASEAIDAGYNEIQHINMVALNFMSDTIDTRTPLRFSMIGEHAHSINVNGPAFTKFIQQLKRNNIVIDPTVSIFEGMLCSKAGEPDPQFAEILDRLPIQVKRGFYSGGLPIAEDKEALYKASFDKLLDMIRVLHESGVSLVPGTDAMSGFALHKELENYVRAGIPEADVLKMATITSAEVCGYQDQLGSIEEGKLADLILLDGNPLENISDIRRVVLTIKDGNVYSPKKMYEAIGVGYFE